MNELKQMVRDSVHESLPEYRQPRELARTIRRRSRRRTGVRVTAIVAGTVAASIALGPQLTSLNGPASVQAKPDGPVVEQPLSVAAVALRRAADSSIGSQDPAVGPGKYLKISSIERHLATVEDVGSGRPYSYLDEERFETWVPGQRNENWYSYRSGREPKELVQRSGTVRSIEDVPQEGSTEPERLTARNGDFYGSGAEPSWQSPTYAWLAELPRDPQQLLDRLRRDANGKSRGEEAAIFTYAADVLRSGIVPGDLRAALFRALSLLPGVVITDERANLAGRTGIAIGVSDVQGERSEIVFDPDTGQVIGQRSVAVRGYIGAPAGTVTSSTAVTTTVDEAPSWAR